MREPIPVTGMEWEGYSFLLPLQEGWYFLLPLQELAGYGFLLQVLALLYPRFFATHIFAFDHSEISARSNSASVPMI